MMKIPTYTGLKDFSRGVQKLYEIHGNIPVFISCDGKVAPFGIAIQNSSLLGGDAIMFVGGASKPIEEFQKGTVTD